MEARRRWTRREFMTVCAASLVRSQNATAPSAPLLAELEAGWHNPPRSARPHTRWWWLGSAVSQQGIDWQLEQMRAKGIGGVEIIFAWNLYQKGNIQYLSAEWFDILRHAVDKAAALDMEVAITFGPGWDLGGSWVPPEEICKCLAPGWVDLQGPGTVPHPLPIYDEARTPRSGWYRGFSTPEGKPRDQLPACPLKKALDWLSNCASWSTPQHRRPLPGRSPLRPGSLGSCEYNRQALYA